MNRNTDVLFDNRDGIAVITLNRPQALNALTMAMVDTLYDRMAEWAVDESVRAVVIRGAGDRAFCAGGDVVAVAESRNEPGNTLREDFFRTEYRMNRLIHHFPKPYIALMHGVTMGGGVGLSVHGHCRVVTERTMLAMPETGIGLFPDVGGSHFLPRCPGAIGLYLALTGARLNAADCLYAGIADSLIPVAEHDSLIDDLRGGADLDMAFAARAAEPGPSALEAEREAIDRCFSKNSVEEIEAALAAEGTDWAVRMRHHMADKSPLCQKIAMRQLREGASLDFDACMMMEYRLSQHCMAGHDFFEGVRALLVDKDKKPQWQPATLGEVSDAMVDGYFAPLGEKELTF
ncbi:MAG: enoyl-CoA hydratase/isomerase family protein [Alphaproteobacteria bacterium]